MSSTGLKIAHITIDGKEIDEETDIKSASDLTQKSSDVLAMYNEKKPMFIKFYANWCGHCKTNDVFWKQLVSKAREDKDVKNANVAIVEVESKNMNKDINKIIDTEGLKKVEGFPTIGTITYTNGKALFKPYEGNRETNAMFAAVKALATAKQGGGAKRSTGSAKRKHRKTKRKQSRSKQSRSKQSRSKQSRSKQSRSKRKQSRSKQSRSKQSRSKRN